MCVKVKMYQLSDAGKKGLLGDFYTMLTFLKRGRGGNVLKRYLSRSGIIMVSRRMQIAKLLLSEYTHSEISDELRVGTSTILNINKRLSSGLGEYTKMFKDTSEQTVKSLKKS